MGAINPGQDGERLEPCPAGPGDTLTQCSRATPESGLLLSMTRGSKATHLLSHLRGPWHLQGTLLTTHPRCSRPPSGMGKTLRFCPKSDPRPHPAAPSAWRTPVPGICFPTASLAEAHRMPLPGSPPGCPYHWSPPSGHLLHARPSTQMSDHFTAEARKTGCSYLLKQPLTLTLDPGSTRAAFLHRLAHKSEMWF